MSVLNSNEYDTQRIASGAYGTAYLYTHKQTKKQFVVKKAKTNIDKSDIIYERKTYMKLYKLLNASCKTFFPKIYNYTVDEQNDPIVVLEYVDGMTLRKYLDEQYHRLSKTAKAEILSDVQKAIMCMWKNGYIHGDLHSNNIMITGNKNIKLIDFGYTIKSPSPYANHKGIDIWFDKAYSKIKKARGMTLGNPNTTWFGLYKPHHARNRNMIKRLIKNSGYNHEKPITRYTDLQKLARVLDIPKYYVKSKHELMELIYGKSLSELRTVVDEFLPLNVTRRLVTKIDMLKALYNIL